MIEESSEKNRIYYNKTEILNEIKKKGKYESKSVIIIKWEDEINQDTEMYIIKSKEDQEKNIPFIGVVNYNFKREGFCINNYSNGDQYFGYYSNDLRNKQGLYIYKPKLIVNKIILYQYYFGLWENDYKNGRGVYIWLKEDKDKNKNNINDSMNYNPFYDFNGSSFQAYVGEVEKNIFTRGALLKKEKDNYFIYYGTFNEKLQKNGDNCFYYSAKLEEIFYGTFKNDAFNEGYVGKFNENGDIKDVIKYQNKSIIEKSNLSKADNLKNIFQKLLKFRNIIMSQDYFGLLFDTFKNVIDFKKENMNDINIFNSDKYLDLMDIAASYNKISIYKEIEKYLNE